MSYDFDYFAGRDLTYPKKPTRPTLGRNPTALEARGFAELLGEYEENMLSYEEDLSLYYYDMKKRSEEFQSRLKKDFVLSEAAFEIIWVEAYDRAHSGGLEEVYNEFDRLHSFRHTIITQLSK